MRPALPFVALVLLLAGAAVAVPVPGDGPFQVTLFHTNDIHGSFLPEPASWRTDKAQVGGFVALARHLAAERRTAAAAELLVDGGDFMTGNPVTAITDDDGVAGVAMAELMSLSGYDAGVIGNHEFDAGFANIGRLAGRFRYPLLAAELTDAAGRPIFRAAPLILERGGLRIAVLGVSCAELRDVCPPSRLQTMVTGDQTAAVLAQLASLTPHTDLQVLISHTGLDGDRQLARNLAAAGLDVIVGGHSHTRLEEPQVVEGVLIVQAGSNLKNLGRLDLAVANGRVTEFRGGLVELTATGGEDAPAALLAAVDRYRQVVETVYGERIGELATTWRRNASGESNLGNWICEAMRARAGTDVAVLNSGGIRRNLQPGPITLLDIHQTLPFANALVVIELTGAQLRQVAQANAAAAAARSYGILQIAGFAYAYRERAGAVELTEITVGGQPLRDDHRYAVALPDYVAVMSRVYLADLALPPYREVGGTLCEVMVDAVRAAREPITATVDGRMRRLEDGPAGGR